MVSAVRYGNRSTTMHKIIHHGPCFAKSLTLSLDALAGGTAGSPCGASISQWWTFSDGISTRL